MADENNLIFKYIQIDFFFFFTIFDNIPVLLFIK